MSRHTDLATWIFERVVPKPNFGPFFSIALSGNDKLQVLITFIMIGVSTMKSCTESCVSHLLMHIYLKQEKHQSNVIYVILIIVGVFYMNMFVWYHFVKVREISEFINVLKFISVYEFVKLMRALKFVNVFVFINDVLFSVSFSIQLFYRNKNKNCELSVKNYFLSYYTFHGKYDCLIMLNSFMKSCFTESLFAILKW